MILKQLHSFGPNYNGFGRKETGMFQQKLAKILPWAWRKQKVHLELLRILWTDKIGILKHFISFRFFYDHLVLITMFLAGK